MKEIHFSKKLIFLLSYLILTSFFFNSKASASHLLNLTAIPEGIQDSHRDRDSIIVEIRSTNFPFNLVESKKVLLDTLGKKSINFELTEDGIQYYIVIKHRNSIATWSRGGGEIFNGVVNYDFTTGVDKAYGNNMKTQNGRAVFFTGDINQDGVIDKSDLISILNDAENFTQGNYLNTDLNWDGFVDLKDITLCYNNTTFNVSEKIPFADTLGGTLASFPGELVVNVSDTILFRFSANPGITFTDTVVRLVKVDNNNNEIGLVGLLLDNGNLNNGDEIAHDNIYSGKFIFNQPLTGNLFLKGKGKVSSILEIFSQVINIPIYDGVSNNDLNLLLTTQNNAKIQLQTLLAGNPGNIENAANKLKIWLEGQVGVASVEKGGSTSMAITYTSGLKGGLVFSLLDSNGQVTTKGGYQETDSLRRNISPQIPIDKQTTGTNFLNFDSPKYSNLAENYLIDENAVGNRKVLIYSPDFFGPGERTRIINRLQTSACRTFDVNSLIGEAANVNSVFSFHEYGFIIIDSHGSLGKYFVTGELLDKKNFHYYESYIQSGKLAIWKNLEIHLDATIEDRGNPYAISSSFITSMSGTFPNTVILNSSCESTMHPNLSNAFIPKGVKAYFGYSRVVSVGFTTIISDSVTKRLAVDGKTAGQTYFHAIDPSSNAEFQIRVGNPDVKYSTSLLNNDFEFGTIATGWSVSGDGRVLNGLGFLSPTQGKWMGIISTGLGYTTSSGSISQCLFIGTNESSLSLKWNFLSEEFLEFIGSIYQDFFEIKLIKEDGSSVILFRKTVDQIAVDFGATPTNPGLLISVSPSIIFDRGGVYMTNWQSNSFNVIPYRGQTVTIVLTTGDVGDSIYDTAILLDEVNVQ